MKLRMMIQRMEPEPDGPKPNVIKPNIMEPLIIEPLDPDTINLEVRLPLINIHHPIDRQEILGI